TIVSCSPPPHSPYTFDAAKPESASPHSAAAAAAGTNRLRDTSIRMASTMSSLTVGEVNAKACVPRAVLWIGAVYTPSLFIGFTVFIAHQFYSMDPIFLISVPWRLPAIVMWGTYMTLVMALVMFTYLSVPRTPFAVRQALMNVGMVSIGFPLLPIVLLVVLYGHTWMFIILASIHVFLIAGVLVLWVWLVRTYN
ncbi:unnamed protein product, partial [Urochloa humidicola]